MTMLLVGWLAFTATGVSSSARARIPKLILGRFIFAPPPEVVSISVVS
jgi:hypothetical protein